MSVLYVRGKDGALHPIPTIKGKDGLTPYIGENGNWWIGETDTGVRAEVTGGGGGGGENGATFTPAVSPEGVISWTNDMGLANPESVNLVSAVLSALPDNREVAH